MPKKTAIQVASVHPQLDVQKEMASYVCRGCKDHTIVQASIPAPYCAHCGSGDLKRTETASSGAAGKKLLESADAELAAVKCPGCSSNLIMRSETASSLNQGGTGHVHCPACSQELSFVLPTEEEAAVDMDKLAGIADENDVDLTVTDGVATLSWPEEIEATDGPVTVNITVSGDTVSALIRGQDDAVVWSGEPANITEALIDLGAAEDDSTVEALQEFAHDVDAACAKPKEQASALDADSWNDDQTQTGKTQEELDAEAKAQQEQADADAEAERLAQEQAARTERDPALNELAALKDLTSTASVVLASVIEGDYDFVGNEEGGVDCVKGGVPVGVLSEVEDPDATVEALRLAVSDEEADVDEILSSNGFDMTRLEIPATDAVEQEVAARVAEHRENFEAASAALSDRIFHSLGIAMTGMNRGMFTELASNPVVKAVAECLVKHTDMSAEEAEAEAIACLDGSSDELAGLVRDQTMELAALDDNVRNDYAKTLGKVRAPRATPRQAETASASSALGERLLKPMRTTPVKEQASTATTGRTRIAELAAQSATFNS